MDSFPSLIQNSVHIERLQQAKRVLLTLPSKEGVKFNINVCARRSGAGIEACIAGLCGFDSWFWERGLVTDVDNNCINISAGEFPASEFSDEHLFERQLSLAEFFGTERPFYGDCYPLGRPVSLEDAIAALDREIERLASTSTVSSTIVVS